VPTSTFYKVSKEIKNILHYAVKRYTSVAVRKRKKNTEYRTKIATKKSFVYFLPS